MAETEVIENEIASKKFNRQLETVDIRVVSELVAELRGARMFGYDYIDIAKLERGILAVAALQGFSQVLSAEEAIYRLADSGSEVADRIKGLEEGNDTLADELEEARKALEKADARIAELEKRPAGGEVEVLFITEKRAENTADLLTEANEVLVKVPGQRGLAQRAIHAAQFFADMTPSTVVIVEEDEL